MNKNLAIHRRNQSAGNIDVHLHFEHDGERIRIEIESNTSPEDAAEECGHAIGHVRTAPVDKGAEDSGDSAARANPDAADPVGDRKPPRPIADDAPAQADGPAKIRGAGKHGMASKPTEAHLLHKSDAIYDRVSNRLYAYDPGPGLWKPLAQEGRMAATVASPPGAFNRGTNRIHVANGMLQIAEDGTVALLPFSPDYFSRNQCPIAWDPHAKCPEFLAAIGQVLQPDDVRALRCFFGQCLLGKNHTQVILVLRGPAGLMKSTLQQIMILLVGSDNVESLRPGHLGGRFEMDRFVGMQLLVAADVASDFLANRGARYLKSLTGGDMIKTERKGSNGGRGILGDFNVCMTANVNLRVRLEGDRDAYERRLLLLDFSGKKPARVIPDLATRLVAKEGPGILRWAVQGAVDLLHEIRSTGLFPRSPAQKARVAELLDQSDSVAVFVSKRVQRSPGDDMAARDLFLAYDDFCGTKGWGSLLEKDFLARLPHLMITLHGVVRTNGIQRGSKTTCGYRGVRLVETSPKAGM